MRYKVITKHDSVINYFDNERRAKYYASQFYGKVIDTKTGKIIYDFCLKKNRNIEE
jgi:hypothetical protein